MSDSPQRTPFEKHAQTVIQVVIGALCIWMATTTSQTSKDVAVLNTQFDTLHEDIVEIKQETKDRYTSSDAKRDNDVLSRRIEDLRRRLDSLESRD